VDLFGACHGGPDRKYKVLTTDVKVAAPKHAVTRGVKDLRLKDEFYYRLKVAKPAKAVTPLLTAAIDGEDHMVAWAYERPGGGRAFGFSGLHYHENWKREEYRRLVAQGVLWSVGLEVPAGGMSVPLDEKAMELKKGKK
jgi:type 1 glutamine amidotransferase